MRRPLIALGVAAFIALAVIGGHSASYGPEAVLADTNGTCIAMPSPLPTVAPNYYGPVLPACAPNHQLQVQVVSGGYTGAVYPAPSSSPFIVTPSTSVPVYPAPSSSAFPIVGGLPYTNYAGARSTLLVVKGSPGVLGRIINSNTTAQTATFSCYDNATAASGTVLWAGILTASQVVDLEMSATNGITCNASAATVSGNGINVTGY